MSFRITRRSRASWQGTDSEGGGRIQFGSGAYEGPFTLRARVEDVERGTNPVSKALSGPEITLSATLAGT